MRAIKSDGSFVRINPSMDDNHFLEFIDAAPPPIRRIPISALDDQ